MDDNFYDQYAQWDSPEEEGRYAWQPRSYDDPRNPLEDVQWTPGMVADLAGEESRPPALPSANSGTPPPGGSQRDPRAGPDGSRTPNLDPPGYRGGYWMNGQWVQGSPGSGGAPRDFGTDGLATTTGSGPDYSQFLPYPEWQSAGPFTYEKFAPSTYEDLEKQPGFLEGQERLRKQIEAGAAYRGMVRSGMTLGDLWTGLDTNKQQRFAEFDSRRFRDHTANYGFSRDAYDRHATDVDRGNNYRFNAADASFKDAYARWKTQVDSLTNIATAGDR